MKSLNDFVDKYLGVPDTGDTPGNRGQCVGLVEVWCDTNGTPHIAGNAKDLLDNADLKAYKLIHNNPQNYPPPGAIVCWDGSWGAGYGHTAVVLFANVSWLVVFEANNPDGHAPVVATHGYAGVQGWLVLR